MKKLALAIATLFLAATPALACPDMESGHGEKDNAPKTADKDKKDAKGQDKAKPAPKAAEKPKTAKPDEKKPAAPKTNDKVSAK